MANMRAKYLKGGPWTPERLKPQPEGNAPAHWLCVACDESTKGEGRLLTAGYHCAECFEKERESYIQARSALTLGTPDARP
jgi:hypothetical protein